MLNDKSWLESRYLADEMTTTQIATLCGVSHKTVSRWLHRHGIPVRSNRIAQLKVGRKSAKESMLNDVRDYTDVAARTIK
jgi:IS30 family transposase